MTRAEKLRYDATNAGYAKELSQIDVFMAGLYLGEGAKTASWTMVNSDPDAIKLAIAWILDNGSTIAGVKINVHHLNERSKEEVIEYWRNVTGHCNIKVYRCKSTPSSSKNPSKKAVSNMGVCYVWPKRAVYFLPYWFAQYAKVVAQTGFAPV